MKDFFKNINENGKCESCKTQIYVTTLTAADSKFNGLVMLLKRTSDVSVKLASSELCYGIAYGYVVTKIEYETVGGFFVDGNMLFDEETGVCAYCGYGAAVLIRYPDENNEETVISGDSFDEATEKVDNNLVTKSEQVKLKLYKDAQKADHDVTPSSATRANLTA